jgi:hypothetical protein
MSFQELTNDSHLHITGASTATIFFVGRLRWVQQPLGLFGTCHPEAVPGRAVRPAPGASPVMHPLMDEIENLFASPG